MKRNTRTRGVSKKKATTKRGGWTPGAAHKPTKMSDPTRGFRNFEERLHGPESMIRDHTPARYTRAKSVGEAIEKLRRAEPLLYDTVAKIKLAWFLVKVAHMFLASGDKTEPVKVKRYEGKPYLAFSSESGIRYRSKVEIDHGKPNKYMKEAHDEYGKVNITLPIIRSDDKTDEFARTRAFSLAGCNRQGVMTDFLAEPKEDSIEEYVPADVYRYYGLPSNGLIMDFWMRECISSDFRNQLGDPEYEEYSNLELYSCINSRYSVHNFYNGNMYSDINIKVYVCRYKDQLVQGDKKPELQPIWYDVAWFENKAIGNRPFLIPQVGPIYGNNDGNIGGMSYNWFGFEDPVDVGLHGSVASDAEFQSIQRYAELSLALGVTPLQSPTFRKKWDVIDVVDATIGPEDTWELEIVENFSKSTNIMDWAETFQPLPNKMDSQKYTRAMKCTDIGDVVLFVTFTGSPSPFYVIKPDSTQDTPTNSIPVEAAPAKLRHTVTHGLNVSWPEVVQTVPVPDKVPKGWNAIKEVTNNVNRESYKYDIGEIFVPSNKEMSRGGSKTEGFEKGPWPPPQN